MTEQRVSELQHGEGRRQVLGWKLVKTVGESRTRRWRQESSASRRSQAHRQRASSCLERWHGGYTGWQGRAVLTGWGVDGISVGVEPSSKELWRSHCEGTSSNEVQRGRLLEIGKSHLINQCWQGHTRYCNSTARLCAMMKR